MIRRCGKVSAEESPRHCAHPCQSRLPLPEQTVCLLDRALVEAHRWDSVNQRCYSSQKVKTVRLAYETINAHLDLHRAALIRATSPLQLAGVNLESAIIILAHEKATPYFDPRASNVLRQLLSKRTLPGKTLKRATDLLELHAGKIYQRVAQTLNTLAAGLRQVLPATRIVQVGDAPPGQQRFGPATTHTGGTAQHNWFLVLFDGA